MTSKIAIKLGLLEVEYEGNEEFLSEKLPEIVSVILRIFKESEIILPTTATSMTPQSPLVSQESTGVIGTTETLAAKLGASTGPELAIVAAARLQIGLKQTPFTRANILEEMKNATSYYNKNYSSNLTRYISGLVKSKKLIESSKGKYTLSAETRKDVESRLGL